MLVGLGFSHIFTRGPSSAATFEALVQQLAAGVAN